MGILSRAIDSAIATVSPLAGLRRQRARLQMGALRSYDAAKIGDQLLANLRAPRTSADAELWLSNHTTRARAWELYRNNPGARAIAEAWVSLVVGSGIDIEPNTPDQRFNDAIREVWIDWCENSDAGCQLDFWEQQRQHCRAQFIAGEAVWHYVALSDTSRIIPSAIHAIEADQISDYPVQTVDKGNLFRAGVEVGNFHRPRFYHLLNRHPGDYPFPAYVPKGVRIPAQEIQHTYNIARAGQTRGESGLSAVVTVLAQEKELVDAELTAAKIGAAFAVFLAQVGLADAGGDGLQTGESNTDDNGNTFTRVEPGAIYRGMPGEKPEVIANNRPSQQVAPFRDGLRGDLAGATLVPRRFIDRDVSKANYSSMRCDMIDTKRLLDPVQRWFGRATAGRTYLQILPELAIAAGMPLPTDRHERRAYMRHDIMPQGWEYVDPEKDINALVDAMANGLDTARDGLGTRGKDFRYVLKQNGAERKSFKAAGVPYPGEIEAKQAAAKVTKQEEPANA